MVNSKVDRFRRVLVPCPTKIAVLSIVVILLAGGCAIASVGNSPVVFSPMSSGVTMSQNPSTDDVLDIYSESGIGKALLWVAEPARSTDITLRLHLHGLEQLTISSGDSTVIAAVASYGTNAVTQSSVDQNGTETPIDPGSPLWMTIDRGETVGGMPQYFDVTLPAAVTQSNGIFRLSWIDFYR